MDLRTRPKAEREIKAAGSSGVPGVQYLKEKESGPGGAGLAERLTGGEPLWFIPARPRDISLGVCMPSSPCQQAAPWNDPSRDTLSPCYADEQSPNATWDKTSRAVTPGSRLFNSSFGVPHAEKNMTRSLGMLPSGSPPVTHSTRPAPPDFWLLAPSPIKALRSPGYILH